MQLGPVDLGPYPSLIRDYVLNHVIGRIPLVAARMRLYRLLGVDLVDPTRGMIMLGAVVRAPELLHIEPSTIIGPGCTLDARGGIRIGRSVNIGGQTILQTAKHLVDDPRFTAAYGPIVVGDRAWIAERAIVLGGVTIGEGAVVAAGAVVTHDVAPYSVVGGIPARHIRTRPGPLDYELDYRADFV